MVLAIRKVVVVQKITTFLWFDHQAKEAARFHTSIFKNSKVISRQYTTGAGPGTARSLQGNGFEHF